MPPSTQNKHPIKKSAQLKCDKAANKFAALADNESTTSSTPSDPSTKTPSTADKATMVNLVQLPPPPNTLHQRFEKLERSIENITSRQNETDSMNHHILDVLTSRFDALNQ